MKQRFEHKSTEPHNPSAGFLKDWQAPERDGWELCGILYDSYKLPRFFWKRPVE